MGPLTLRLRRSEEGAMALVTLFFALFLVGILYYVVGIGHALLYRERMQDAADAAAFGAAIMHARGMNLLALINMVMAALLAILVALRLIQMLLVVAMIACAFVTFGQCVPPLMSYQMKVMRMSEKVRPWVEDGLRILHTAGQGVRVVIPATAAAGSALLVKQHYDKPALVGFAVPTRLTLPTEDDTYAELCNRAADQVGGLVAKPIDLILGKSIAELVSDAVSGLAKVANAWFCTPGAKRPSFEVSYKIQHPVLSARRKCVESAQTATDEDVAIQLCEAADDADERSQPDDWSGECIGGCDPALYAERIERARVDCDPNAHPKRSEYRYQERTRREYLYEEEGKPAEWRADPPSWPRRSYGVQAPACPVVDGKIQWNHELSDADGTPLPVCEYVQHATAKERHIVMVTQVFGCLERVKRKEEAPDISQDPALSGQGMSDRRVPQKMMADVDLGDETFQLRAYVLGREPSTRSDSILDVVSFHREKAATPTKVLRQLGRIQVAQAEYYFAGPEHADKREWLWSMQWQARLRRFRYAPPEQQSTNVEAGEAPALDLAGACGSAAAVVADAQPVCGLLGAQLPQLRSLLLH